MYITQETKFCTGCREERPLDQYHNSRSRPDGKVSRCITCRNRVHREWSKNNRDKERNYRLKTTFGITQEDYNTLLACQGGVCLMCERPPADRPLEIDHNHETGAIRGLLCRFCNLVLGNAFDSPETLEAGARYLRSQSPREEGYDTDSTHN